LQTSTERVVFQRAGGPAVAAVFVAAATVLVATGTSRIRYSADHDRTIGVWEIAVPVAVATIAFGDWHVACKIGFLAVAPTLVLPSCCAPPGTTTCGRSVPR
jgi:hypothetical protein